MTQKPPLPPFTQESARQKVRMAEEAWNTRDPEKVSLAYTPGQRLAQSPRLQRRPGRHRSVLDAEVAARAGLSPDQGIMGVPRALHRRALSI